MDKIMPNQKINCYKKKKLQNWEINIDTTQIEPKKATLIIIV